MVVVQVPTPLLELVQVVVVLKVPLNSNLIYACNEDVINNTKCPVLDKNDTAANIKFYERCPIGFIFKMFMKIRQNLANTSLKAATLLNIQIFFNQCTASTIRERTSRNSGKVSEAIVSVRNVEHCKVRGHIFSLDMDHDSLRP